MLPAVRSNPRSWARTTALLALLLGAAAARAEETPADGGAARARRGEYCTPLSCAPRPVSTIGATAGFAIAVLAAGRLAQRPRE
jgi:hypothetical protein